MLILHYTLIRPYGQNIMICRFNQKAKNMKSKFGFTLIELLIVVAIIAILAAIAIPNFLMAQVRAKVSRAQGELRTLATALESYRVDQTMYPLVWNGFNGPFLLEDRWAQLTTPVAYISSIPEDPFGDKGVTVSDPGNFRYKTYDYVSYGNDNSYHSLYNGFFAPLFNKGFSREIKWYATSQGPDLLPGLAPGGGGIALVYDPSNGTVSKGDIFRVGP